MDKRSHLPSPDPPGIDTIIARLANQQTVLSRYIDRRWSDLGAIRLARLLSIHGQCAVRLGRLLRDRRVIHGDPPDPVQQGIDLALDELSAEWGIDLGPPAYRDRDGPTQLPVDLEAVIADLDGKCTRLARHLACCVQEDDDAGLSHLFAVYSRNEAHLGCLFRIRHLLYRPLPQEMEDLLAQMVDGSAQDLGSDT
jgi:hypothetical protein